MDWLSIVLNLIGVAPKVKEWIDIGLSVNEELKKTNPKIIPILEQVGGQLFPALKDPIHIVAAAADAIFNPHGTMWLQGSLNKLVANNLLKVPATYVIDGATVKLTGVLSVDGAYGRLTKATTEIFQTAHQPLAGPVDGWSGPKTQAVLMAELAKLLPTK